MLYRASFGVHSAEQVAFTIAKNSGLPFKTCISLPPEVGVFYVYGEQMCAVVIQTDDSEKHDAVLGSIAENKNSRRYLF